MPPSRKKMYITLSLVHLIHKMGDNFIRQNACLFRHKQLVRYLRKFEFCRKIMESLIIFKLKIVLVKEYSNGRKVLKYINYY